MARLPCPDWEIAKGIKYAYAEDGVSGKIGYDPDIEQWYFEPNDSEYMQYIENLSEAHKMILHEFAVETWDGVNIQGQAIEPPKESENRLALYIIHNPPCATAKGFKVKHTLAEVVSRKSAQMFFGSTCEACGHKTMIVLRWEDVKPKKGGE